MLVPSPLTYYCTLSVLASFAPFLFLCILCVCVCVFLQKDLFFLVSLEIDEHHLL